MNGERATQHRSQRIEQCDTIVIGGGQSGLAVAQQLMERGVDVVVLDAHDRVGDQWRNRWDSLRLFTPAGFSGLPGMVFPSPTHHLPDKDEVAAYLERYAERFEITVRAGERVESITRAGTVFTVHTARSVFEARNIVVATGALERPRVPLIAHQLNKSIQQLHSSEYRNPFGLPDGPALVVGAGTSGVQIALELSRFRKVWLAGRATRYLPRRLFGRDLFAWLWPIFHFASSDTRLGRWLRESSQRGGDARIGITESMLRDAGISRMPVLDSARGGLPAFGDDVLHPRIIIWCTGYVSEFRWIDLPAFDESGRPRHSRGVSVDIAGLYFIGLRFQHRLTSTLLGGVGADAAYVAEHIAKRQPLYSTR